MEITVQFTGRGARRRKEHDFADMAVGDLREFDGKKLSRYGLNALRESKLNLAKYHCKTLEYKFASAVDYDNRKVYVKRVK